MAWWIAVMLAGVVRAAPVEPQTISGANLVGECQFPQVVSLRGGEELCSASLVHPQVVVTAAHCVATGTPATVHLGESHGAEEYAYDVERCEVYPESVGSLAETHDFAYCVLVNPITALPAIPLLAGCEIDAIGEGTVAVIAGYGLASAEGNFGRKRYAFTRLASDVREDGTVRVGDAGANGCDGDSGGPALVQLADGSWRVIGVLSTAPPCGEGAGLYRTLADRIDWLEERSGFDLTPCWDGDGAWTDGEACGGFDADPRVTQGGSGSAADWASFCAEVGITPSMTCAAIEQGTSSSGEAGSSAESESSSGAGGDGADEDEAGVGGCGCDQRGRGAPGIGVVLWLARRRGARRARSCAWRIVYATPR